MDDLKLQEELITLFKEIYGSNPQIEAISGGGSSRKYFRLKSGVTTAVGVIGDDVEENRTFIKLDRLLKQNGVNVPEVLAISESSRCYIIEDLGDTNLMSILHGENKMLNAQKALKDLIKIQAIPEKEWIVCVGYKPFSRRLVKWDLNYFKYDFLKPSEITFDEEKLEDDFDRLCDLLISSDLYEGLMYRDFQSRNIMIKDNELWFIDFQGARKGPVVYDAVSFIWQSKAPFTFEERENLSLYYADLLAERGLDKNEIIKGMKRMSLFRCLQVLGAYGFRGLIQKKSHFLESIPYAINNLNYFAEKGILSEFPEIEKVALQLKSKYSNHNKIEEKGLTLKVMSFSYKIGYPEDKSGNGGGFIFDCRALHNPGRYEEYKRLTGRDQEVIDFLKKESKATEFINNAINIVSPSIEKYSERGFNSLQVGFGCTGGRHRSVYCAENFARKIKALYPEVKIRLEHREQNINTEL